MPNLFFWQTACYLISETKIKTKYLELNNKGRATYNLLGCTKHSEDTSYTQVNSITRNYETNILARKSDQKKQKKFQTVK